MSELKNGCRKDEQSLLGLGATCSLPTKFSKNNNIQIMSFDYNNMENVVIALVHKNDQIQNHDEPLVRLHSACVTSEIFGSEKCDCSAQFNQAMEEICCVPYGIMLYLAHHEGRGIGLKNKILAYQLQEKGANTLEANELLGFPHDMRNFQAAIEVLRYLKVSSLKLLTNNPDKVSVLNENGIKVTKKIPLFSGINPYNRDYLLLKQNVLNHDFGNILQ